MEISEIRRQLRQTIEAARRRASERRARVDAASRAWEPFLTSTAIPVVRMFANALKAEGHAFQVFTPAGGLRLMSERSSDDFIEFLLDTTADPPAVIGRVNRGRGSRLITTERAIRPDAAVEALTQEDVLEFLLEEIAAFIER
ncbi:MAG: hypothetical protein ACE148_09180 [Vicinamibacterales bacterium]